MEHSTKQQRVRIGLLRQKGVQSTEKSPLIGNEIREYPNNEPIPGDCLHQTNETIKAKEIDDNHNEKRNKPRRHQTPEPITTADGRSFTTLHRGLLKKQSTSTTSQEKSISIAETPETPLSPTEKAGVGASSLRDVTKGILFALLGAGVMYGLTGVFVRLAGENGVGAGETLLVRSAVQSVLFGSLMAYKKSPFRPPEGRVKLCILIAIAYSIATAASFEAFNVIPPGNAIATRGAARTVFAVLFSFLLSSDRIYAKDLVAVCVCVAGISMIIASSLTNTAKDYVVPAGMQDNKVLVNAYGYSLIVLAGITRSLGMIGVRKVKDEIHSFSVVLYHSSLTVFAAVFFLLIRPSPWPPSAAGIGYTLAVCVTSSIATWSSNYAVQLVHPALVSLAQNADLVVSIILEHTILEMLPDALELVGAGLILLGVSGLSYLKWRESKTDSP